MKFTPILTGGQIIKEKALHSSASSKVLLREGDFEQAEVARERVLVAAGELGQQLRHYQWRNRTEFPIVRVAAWQVRCSDGVTVELQVLRESVPITLDLLADLPLFRALYLLKETLIACERLFQRFGAFRISGRMVGVNQAHKCRVWINEDFASNTFQPLGEDEHGFLRQVGALFESKTLKGKAVGSFYGELEKCNSCAAALAFIEQYTREYKIAIPSFFKSDRLPEATTLQTTGKFQPSLTMNRSPRFITSLRDTLTPTVKHPAKEEEQAEKAEVKQEVKPSLLLALKKSAETRADIYGSGTMTITDSKSREDLFQHQHQKFFSAQEINPLPQKTDKMQKSELLQFKPKAHRPHKPTHRVTNRELFSCFTPQPQAYSRAHEQWDVRGFLSPPVPVEDKEGLQDELESLFEKNHWEQRIDGLFGGEGELKRSVHAGEPQWRHSEFDLPLLQNFGKVVMQSALHEQR